MSNTTRPSHMDPAIWYAAYNAEADAIAEQGWEARRDRFNADFPAPYTGRIDEIAHARFAAICSRTRGMCAA